MEYHIEKLCMNYGDRKALQNFTYTFGTGVYGLIGPNGAGKTTLMQLMAGVFRPTSGSVSLDGKEYNTMSPSYAAYIGYLPQEIVMYPEFTVRQYLEYVAALKKVKSRSAVSACLKLANLEDRAKTRCHKLSGGMKRRLGIAQAVLGDPKVLILDEPTTGVDITERVRFRQIISELSADRAVIYSTHTSEDLELVAKEIILMKKGQIISAGPGSTLLAGMNGKVWESRMSQADFRRAQKERPGYSGGQCGAGWGRMRGAHLGGGTALRQCGAGARHPMRTCPSIPLPRALHRRRNPRSRRKRQSRERRRGPWGFLHTKEENCCAIP